MNQLSGMRNMKEELLKPKISQKVGVKLNTVYTIINNIKHDKISEIYMKKNIN